MGARPESRIAAMLAEPTPTTRRRDTRVVDRGWVLGLGIKRSSVCSAARAFLARATPLAGKSIQTCSIHYSSQPNPRHKNFAARERPNRQILRCLAPMPTREMWSDETSARRRRATENGGVREGQRIRGGFGSTAFHPSV